MTYQEQLKSPQWQKKRLEIMERDEFECKHCNENKKTLNVHHIIYHKNKKLWEYDEIELITLCESCHKKLHYTIKWMTTTITLFKWDNIEFDYKKLTDIIYYLQFLDNNEIDKILKKLVKLCPIK